MGNRGPRPLSSEVLRLRGSLLWKQRAKQEKRTTRVSKSPRSVSHEAPDWLSPDARDVWAFVAGWLGDVIEEGDIPLMSLYCETYAQFVAASKRIKSEGLTLQGRDGGVVRHPLCSVVAGYRASLIKLGTLLGLDPAARSRLRWAIDEVAEPDPDPFDEFVLRRKAPKKKLGAKRRAKKRKVS